MGLLMSAMMSVADDWMPAEDGYDWIKLNSNEWLKGKLIAMYDDNLKFDSDELDVLDFDWEDVALVRTSKLQSIRLTSVRVVVSRILIKKETVTMVDSGEQFPRDTIISIAAGGEHELNYWEGKVKLGFDKRSGNTDQQDVTIGLDANRRTSVTRFKYSYLGTKSKVEDVNTEESHRLTASLDWFFSQRVFFRPVNFEYFRDPFQNIDSRMTYSAQVGYYLIDNSKTFWDISIGPGYQETKFDKVSAGEKEIESTPVIEFESEFEHEIAKNIDIDSLYTVKIVNENSGKYNHHFELGLEVDLIGELDLDVRYIWDRIEEPAPDDLGAFPDKNDQRIILSLSYEF